MLAATLEQEGIKPRPRKLVNGKVVTTERFMIGPLAHILKNRFYIGEVVYRGEVYEGEHEPIIDHALFKAVLEKLAASAVQRQTKKSSSSSLLIGLIYDDRGNRMSPSHANRKGLQYRYYVSQALLQHRKFDAGTVSRVSAPDVETLVLRALRRGRQMDADISHQDLVQRAVDRVEVHADRITVTTRKLQAVTDEVDPSASKAISADETLSISFPPTHPLKQGITHAPTAQATIDSKTQETLLQAIWRARRWMDQILSHTRASFDTVAKTEGLAERYVRRLAVLAFLSPRIIKAIADGSAPANLTISNLTQALPHIWADQEAMLGVR